MPTVKIVLCLFIEKKKLGLQKMLGIWLQQNYFLIIFCYEYESVVRRRGKLWLKGIDEKHFICQWDFRV